MTKKYSDTYLILTPAIPDRDEPADDWNVFKVDRATNEQTLMFTGPRWNALSYNNEHWADDDK
jgi:hypothetical protein